jgi:ectoine hydroxylase-related dioxygenase (phytanoyl-CoA dioxygenase family)
MTMIDSAGSGAVPLPASGTFSPADCSLDDFRATVERSTDPHDYPHADAIEQNVPVYGRRMAGAITSAQGRREVLAELARALTQGPGIVVFQGAFEPAVVDRATAVFEDLIAGQKAAGVVSGDHFAKPGSNDRVWGALDKFALADPEAFAAYYGNDVLALICTAWLGPGYQVTSQINVVNPGGQAQTAHRDFHLGFMSSDQAQAFPVHAHLLTPALTLQGAVAHCDMPLETGPTLYLPFSQTYPAGYLAFHRPEFTEYFLEHRVQLPLAKGDAAFFNPALFHGAGTNVTADVRRMANLIQVASAFGRAMETTDRTAISVALYPVLLAARQAGAPESFLDNVIAASAEGYAFPTNLDRDQPVDGLAPQTQAELVRAALRDELSPDAVTAALREQESRHRV